ncbi:hypothetical protein FQR65_LT09864 [Abscondita terminalis]|nr:hypothetical protein FQR65_LT09864 [Abscondita terminalis]
MTLGRKMPDDVVKIFFELMGPHNEGCIQKHKPDLNDVDVVINRGFLPLHKGVMCYTLCLYESVNILQSNGEVHMENLLGLLSYMTPEITQMCADEAEWYSGSDMCEKGGFVPLHKGVMCYTHCLYESAEILQSNGEVHMENLMGLLSYMTPELTEMCSHEAEWYSGTDMCEKGYILGNCVIHALAE